MASEIFALALSVLGIVFLLYYALYRTLLWGEKGGVFVIPLYPHTGDAGMRINNFRIYSDFMGLTRRSIIVAVDYGIKPEYINRLKKDYEGSQRVFVCTPAELNDLIFEKGERFN